MNRLRNGRIRLCDSFHESQQGLGSAVSDYARVYDVHKCAMIERRPQDDYNEGQCNISADNAYLE